MRLNMFLFVVSGAAIWRSPRDEVVALKRGWSRGGRAWQRNAVLDELLVKMGRRRVKPNVTFGAFCELCGLRP